MYLSSTNRAFLTPPSTAERIENSLRILDMARNKVNTIGVIRNTVNRDADLRGKTQSYWVNEGVIMNEFMEDGEVVRGVNDALENRIQMKVVERDATDYAEKVIGPLGIAMQTGNL